MAEPTANTMGATRKKALAAVASAFEKSTESTAAAVGINSAKTNNR